MGLLNQLLECEFNYSKLLSQMEDNSGILSFRDEKNPDYPMQNYTYITRDLPPKDVNSRIKEEEDRSLDRGERYKRFIFDPFQPYPKCSSLYDYDYSCSHLYIYDLRNSGTINNSNHVNILDSGDLEKYIKLEKRLTRDKSEKHIREWFNISTNSDESKVLLYNNEDRYIGRCDLFFQNNIAKIEDLEVIKEFRSWGAGSEMVKKAIYLAGYNNKNFIYLICNSDLGDFYTKLGFSFYTEFHNFIKYY